MKFKKGRGNRKDVSLKKKIEKIGQLESLDDELEFSTQIVERLKEALRAGTVNKIESFQILELLQESLKAQPRLRLDEFNCESFMGFFREARLNKSGELLPVP